MSTIVIAIISLFVGIRVGLNVRSRKMENKKKDIQKLIIEVRNKNNQMLSNFSKIAHVASHTEGQWTEIDDFIMPMWME